MILLRKEFSNQNVPVQMTLDKIEYQASEEHLPFRSAIEFPGPIPKCLSIGLLLELLVNLQSILEFEESTWFSNLSKLSCR